MNRRWLGIAIGIIVSAGAIWFVARDIKFDKVAGALQSANYWWLVPNVIVILLTMYLRAIRWGAMVRPLKRVAFNSLVSATAIGFMANNILPFRIGEFVRAYSLSRQERAISKSASLAMIFTERVIFDLLALTGIFGIVLLTTTLEIPQGVKDGSVWILLALGIGLSFTLVMVRVPKAIPNLIHNHLGFLPEKLRDFVGDIIERFALGLTFMRSPLAGLNVFAQTTVIWIALGLSNFFVFIAFDLRLPIEASFATLVVVSIAIMIPSTPGFIGVYHGAVQLTLGQYGVDKETALACAFVMHAAQYIIVTLFGLVYLWKDHLTLKDVELVATGDGDSALTDVG